MTDTAQPPRFNLVELLAGQNPLASELSKIEGALGELKFELTRFQGALRNKAVPRTKSGEAKKLDLELRKVQSEIAELEASLASGDIQGLARSWAEIGLEEYVKKVEGIQSAMDALRSVTPEERAKLEELTTKIAFLEAAREAEVSQTQSARTEFGDLMTEVLDQWGQTRPETQFPDTPPQGWQDYFERQLIHTQRHLDATFMDSLQHAFERINGILQLMEERSTGLKPRPKPSKWVTALSFGIGMLLSITTFQVLNLDVGTKTALVLAGVVFVTVTAGIYALIKDFWFGEEEAEREQHLIPPPPRQPVPGTDAGPQTGASFARPRSVPGRGDSDSDLKPF